MILRVTGICIAISLVGVAIYFSFKYLTRNIKSNNVVTVEATFMQYACGEENDDMKIEKVVSAGQQSLVGSEIDPQVIPDSKRSELKEYFYNHRSSQFGLTYRLTGRFSEFKSFGCDNKARKFWVEEIELIDGTNRMTKREIEEAFTKN